MTSTRTRTGVAKFLVGLWTVGALLAIPSAVSAGHQCAGIEIYYTCPIKWGMGSTCVGDAHGEGHPCAVWNFND